MPNMYSPQFSSLSSVACRVQLLMTSLIMISPGSPYSKSSILQFLCLFECLLFFLIYLVHPLCNSLLVPLLLPWLTSMTVQCFWKVHVFPIDFLNVFILTTWNKNCLISVREIKYFNTHNNWAFYQNIFESCTHALHIQILSVQCLNLFTFKLHWPERLWIKWQNVDYQSNWNPLAIRMTIRESLSMQPYPHRVKICFL